MMDDNQAQAPVETLLRDVFFKIATYREAKDRFSSKLAPDFSLFNYFRSDEMALSRIIADLLNPKGTHGHGGIFLEAFVDQLKSEHQWIDSTSDWRVETEKQANGRRRIDIFLESRLGVVGIENKPWACDQDNQLSDYADFLKARPTDNWLLVYLGNDDAQESSFPKGVRQQHQKSGNFVRLDFIKIEQWLRKCLSLVDSVAVRLFIEDLAKFVRININGELDMTEEKEVGDEIVKSENNIKAAFHIANALSASKQRLLKTFQENLKNELKKKSFTLVWDEDMNERWKACCGFGVAFQSSQSLYLRFEFEGPDLNRMFWGIRRRDENILKSQQIWQSINEVMSRGVAEGKQSDWWPWYSTGPNNTFDMGYQDWGKSPVPWVEMDSGELANKIVDLADSIHALFKGPIKMGLLNSEDSNTST